MFRVGKVGLILITLSPKMEACFSLVYTKYVYVVSLLKSKAYYINVGELTKLEAYLNLHFCRNSPIPSPN